MAARTESQLLEILHRHGATRVQRVRLRPNRSTIWSLTQGGFVLNLHLAYRNAPGEVLDHFATIALEAHNGTAAYRDAATAVRAWEGLQPEMDRIRREHRGSRRSAKRRPTRRSRSGPCCATEHQREYLRCLYRYLNRERFDGRLPADMTVRLSNRMKTRLGHMVPGFREDVRQVVEIALNVDLMLEGNGGQRLDTLVHEMAHAAAWLFNGGADHGPSWHRWARHAGCRETVRSSSPILRRARGVRRVTRVPRLPEEASAGLDLRLDR